MVDRALEGDEKLLARQDGQVGLDEHPAGRKVDDLAADESKVAHAHDLAKGSCGASLSGVRALGMEHGAHLGIVWIRRCAGQESAAPTLTTAAGGPGACSEGGKPRRKLGDRRSLRRA